MNATATQNSPVTVSKLETPVVDPYRAWGTNYTYYKWEVSCSDGQQLWKTKKAANDFASLVRKLGYKAALNS